MERNTGMKKSPWIAPITIVNHIVLKKTSMMYASTVYNIVIPAIVEEAPCKDGIVHLFL